MYYIEGEGKFLTHTRWESEAILSILNEILRAGWIESYTVKKLHSEPYDDNYVIVIKNKYEGGTNT